MAWNAWRGERARYRDEVRHHSEQLKRDRDVREPWNSLDPAERRLLSEIARDALVQPKRMSIRRFESTVYVFWPDRNGEGEATIGIPLKDWERETGPQRH